MKLRLFLPVALAAATGLLAQDRDFLSPNEVDQIRQVQDPNDRLLLYIHFAKQRMDLVQHYIAKDKPGRSIFIHNSLEDYGRIIEAIDSVSDDALRRNIPIDKGMIAVADAEKSFLDQLQKLEDSEPRDLDRYKFVLTDAINSTHDSRDLSLEDSKKRSTELAVVDSREKKDREAMMPEKEAAERKKAVQSQSGEDDKKKVPSLYRPGEKPRPQMPH